MFERFTDRSRRVLVLAQEETRAVGEEHLSSSHLLHGLAVGEETIAAKALLLLGVTPAEVHTRILARQVSRSTVSPGSPPFTPNAKRALEMALREALSLGHSYIGTEHLLLGLVRFDNSGSDMLADFGADPVQVRTAVINLMTSTSGPPVEPKPEPPFSKEVLFEAVLGIGVELRPDLSTEALTGRAQRITSSVAQEVAKLWGRPPAS
jgi:ATP-dependent Clp protease ATP-binding subunit ClpC